MIPEGYSEYKSREFCNAIGCEVQRELNKHEKASPAYEEVRKNCRRACRYTAWQFHHWLQEKGYVIVRTARP